MAAGVGQKGGGVVSDLFGKIVHVSRGFGSNMVHVDFRTARMLAILDWEI
jgi:hypothetical protein